MTGSLIRGVLHPWASCGTSGGARVCGGVDRSRAWSSVDSDRQKDFALDRPKEYHLETAVPRVKGKGTRKGLVDSCVEVRGNPRGTPKPWAKERLASGRKTMKTKDWSKGPRAMGDPDTGKETGQQDKKWMDTGRLGRW